MGANSLSFSLFILFSFKIPSTYQPTGECKAWLGLVLQAMKKFTDGDALSILDPRLEQTAANNLAIEKILELALQCLAPRRQSRPSMRRCAEILWNIRKDYREVAPPIFRSFSSRSQMSA